jgi:hypothetical protein
MTQWSVHTAQPAMPDCVEPPVPACTRGAGPSSSVGGAGRCSEGAGTCGGAACGGATSADDGAPDGDAADGCSAGGGASAAASSATDAASANATARPTIMRAGAWVHEPRSIVFLPGAPAGCSAAPESTVNGRDKDASLRERQLRRRPPPLARHASRDRVHAIERTTPPSTRSAAPVVADASREQT